MSAASDLLADRYQLEGQLGRGTFGVVHRAFDTRLKRTVALKVPHRLLASDPEFLEVFTREAETAAALDHPGIVTIYDVGETDDGLPYLAMRFLEGRPLRDIVLTEGVLPVERTFAILDQLASALDYLQARRLVHRDIKPANVMVDAGDRTTLMDFGLARMISGSHLSLSGVLAFTPLYASPEQIVGERLTPASDRYSFAAVAYEMLTGQAPHAAYDSQVLLHAIRFEAPPAPHEINHALSPEVGSVLLAALVKRPEDRPPSSKAIMRNLRAALKRRAPAAEAATSSAATPIAPREPAPTAPLSAAPEPAPTAPLSPPPATTPKAAEAASRPQEAARAMPPDVVERRAARDARAPRPAAAQESTRRLTPLPERMASELDRYTEIGIARVEIFGRGHEVCRACAEARSRSYHIDEAPKLPLEGCTSVWGCHCEYAPLPEEDQSLPKELLAELNPGQRSRLALLRLRYACARGLADRIEIVAEEAACNVCKAAARPYLPEQVPTLPLFDCRRYPPCECVYQLGTDQSSASASLLDAIRKFDANLKQKGWPWQWR